MIFMNPPYDRNLHIKILDQTLKEHPDEVIVNLSPIRWLQDPLAKRKKNSDWNKFENVRNHIESIEVIKQNEASKLFGIASPIDLGIYTLSPQGGWINPWQSELVDKIADGIKDTVKNHLVVDDFDGICMSMSGFIGGKYSASGTKPESLCACNPKENAYFLNKKNEVTRETYADYRDRVAWGVCGPKDKNNNIKFKTREERDNFYDSWNLKLLRWYFRKIIMDTHIHPQFLPWLGDYSHPWTDEEIYKYFNLTEDEIKIIENDLQNVNNII